jgi:hypothetical protein
LRYAAFLEESPRELTAKDCWFDVTRPDFSTEPMSECLRLLPGRAHVLLLGDSHARHLAKSVAEHLPDAQVVTLPIAGCLPVRGYDQPHRCEEALELVLDRWLAGNQSAISGVLLSARWRADVAPALRETLRDLSGRGVDVRVLGPTPEYRIKVPLMLAYEVLLSASLAERVIKPDRFEVDALLQADPVIKPHYISLIAPICEPGSHRCVTQVDGTPLFFDRDHFTAPGSVYALRQTDLSRPRVAKIQ